MSFAKVKLQLVRAIKPQANEPIEASIAGPAADAEAAAMSDAERAALVERLFSHHRTALLQYLTRLLSNSDDAEEVLQETYIRLLRVEHLDQLDDQVRRFLFKIATNLARDRFRQRKSRSYATHIPYELVDLVGDQESPDEIIDWDHGMQVVKQVLLDLPPRHRQVFLLHVTQNMSYRTISRHLGVSTKTVERDIAMVLELCQSRLRTTER